MDSKLGLLIQLNGVFLITVLSLLLRRSLKLTSLTYWTVAWLCLSFALISLRLAFSYEQLRALLFTYYFLGEYLFGFMVVAGCRSLDGDYKLKPRTEVLFVPFVLLSIALPQLTSDFNEIFNIHSLVLAGFFTAAFVQLSNTKTRSLGWRVMYVALAGLSLNSLLFTVAFTARNLWQGLGEFLAFNSVIDLVLQTSLGFGMVIVLLEKVLSDTRTVNERLVQSHKRLEELVHKDPLTAAFNRHAFYGFVKKNGEDASAISGCVGFFDIDDLKSINDQHGHSIGDAAIRAVVKAIRELMRAEDLIYRWGGDEFFVIMIGMEAEMARSRMTRLDDMLDSIYMPEIDGPLSIGVSWGFTNFADPGSLEDAIDKADSAMYRRKQERRERLRESPRFVSGQGNSLPGGMI
ncbi:MAG TPA: GGDEF domain-containing protein [Pyrinomonadaceae bacterium]|nr:GGDEF domain-containing protein [Pyrinomonadaceae bacterium]